MRIRDSLITAAAAASTMALVLTLVGSAPLDAAGPGELALPRAPLPTLVVNGVELTVEGDLDDTPVARVTATNTGDTPAHVAAELRLFAQAPSSPMARMVSMPRETWSQPCLVALGPGETREIEITADALPERHEGYFVLSVGELTLASGRFAPEGLQRLAFANFNEPMPAVIMD